MVGPGTGGQADREANVVISQDSAQPNALNGVRGGELHRPSLSAVPGDVAMTDVVMGPLAEERLTDANDRRAFLDRNVEVGAHPHRQLRAEPRPAVSQPLGQRSKGPERRSGVLGTLDQPADSHEATNVDPRQLDDLVQI
jgi:hypothetical protein